MLDVYGVLGDISELTCLACIIRVSLGKRKSINYCQTRFSNASELEQLGFRTKMPLFSNKISVLKHRRQVAALTTREQTVELR